MSHSPPRTFNEHGLPHGHVPDPDWEIGPAQVKLALDRGDDVVILDCRTHPEVAMARIDGAVHVPMQDIPAQLQSLRDYEDRRIIVHCHHGRRSMQVTVFLRQQGFTDVRSMAGGIEQWALSIDPTMKRY